MHHTPRVLGGLIATSLLTLSLVMGCGQGPSSPGTGTLTVSMAFQNTFGQPEDLDSKLTAENRETAGTGLLSSELIPKTRTPLSDLIISLDSVIARGCSHADTSDTLVVQPLDGDDGDCDSYVVFADSSLTLSVAGLDTTLAHLLGSTELPEGDYSHLWIGISDAWVITQEGDTVAAHLPGDKDRLKVNAPFAIADSTVTDVVIVFDVHRSIVENPPGSMNFKIKPVLHHTQGWAKN